MIDTFDGCPDAANDGGWECHEYAPDGSQHRQHHRPPHTLGRQHPLEVDLPRDASEYLQHRQKEQI